MKKDLGLSLLCSKKSDIIFASVKGERDRFIAGLK